MGRNAVMLSVVAVLAVAAAKADATAPSGGDREAPGSARECWPDVLAAARFGAPRISPRLLGGVVDAVALRYGDSPERLAVEATSAYFRRMAPTQPPDDGYESARLTETVEDGYESPRLSEDAVAEANRREKVYREIQDELRLVWDPIAVDPKTGGAGLGQFTEEAWLRMAADPRLELHAILAGRGLVDAKGKVLDRDRALRVRFETYPSLVAVAQAARTALDRFEESPTLVDGVRFSSLDEPQRLVLLGAAVRSGTAAGKPL